MGHVLRVWFEGLPAATDWPGEAHPGQNSYLIANHCRGKKIGIVKLAIQY